MKLVHLKCTAVETTFKFLESEGGPDNRFWCSTQHTCAKPGLGSLHEQESVGWREPHWGRYSGSL